MMHRIRQRVLSATPAKLAAISLAFALAHFAFAEDQTPGLAAPPDYAAGITQLEQTVAAELKRDLIRGVAIALVDDQRIVLAKGFGFADKARGVPANAQTAYRAGSISKVFTALAAMQFAEQGRLDVDKPVCTHDPQFQIVVPFADAGPITLRQLMCHRAGMIRESPVGGYFDPGQPGIAATVASVAPCVLVHRPNTVTKYSNVGPTVTGRVIELVAGVPYTEYQRQQLLGPIGMENSAFLLNDGIRQRLAPGRMFVADGQGGFGEIEAPLFELGTIPAGNLYTTAEDLARFLTFLFADGRVADKQLIKPETLQQMWTVQLTSEKEGFGMGFYVGQYRDHKTLGHTGAVYGHTTAFLAMPAHKLGVVVLSNEDIAMGPVRRLTEAAMDVLLEARLGEKPKPREEPAALDLAELVRFVGDYESESYWARIDTGEGGLSINVSGQRLEMTAVGKDKFLADGRFACRAPLDFTRDAGGNVTGFDTLGQKFTRVDPAAVGAVPDDWKKFLGSYGPEFIPLIVSLRHGHLYAMTENMFDYRLTPLNRTVFKMPAGMYVDEQLAFQSAPSGEVYSAVLANMTLLRTKPNSP